MWGQLALAAPKGVDLLGRAGCLRSVHIVRSRFGEKLVDLGLVLGCRGFLFGLLLCLWGFGCGLFFLGLLLALEEELQTAFLWLFGELFHLGHKLALLVLHGLNAEIGAHDSGGKTHPVPEQGEQAKNCAKQEGCQKNKVEGQFNACHGRHEQKVQPEGQGL